MGTRAQFFINDPQDLKHRIWLGCVAWDGFPDGDCKILADCKTENEFREAVNKISSGRDDFTDPKKNSFPFPWVNDLFVTDLTYAFINGHTMLTWSNQGFMDMSSYLEDPDSYERDFAEEELPRNVPAPVIHGPKGPDSIILITC